MSRRISPVPFLLPLALLGGCTVGPDYRHPPRVAAQPGWVEPASTGPIDEAWWRSFGDPRLAELVAAADTGNPDVRASGARLAEARADRAAVAGARWPEIDAQGSAERYRVSENGELPVKRIPGFRRDFSLFDMGFDASWEVDLWGRVRRSVEAADARAQAADADARAVRLSLHAEVARTYVDLRAAQARLASLKDEADALAGLAALARQRREAGEGSAVDERQAEAGARDAAASLPGIEADIRADAYRLALLTGRPPEALDPAWLAPSPIPQPPDMIAMGLRSDLLRRRPDIVAAERRLAAATADIGVATADLFPRITLAGGIAKQSKAGGNLLDAASTRFQAGPGVSWPIFDAGAIRARIRGAKAGAREAEADYEKAVLGALNDSETAANHVLHARETVAESRAACEARRAALDLARRRFAAGEADRIELLQAQSAYAAARDAAAQAKAAHATQAVALYKALGGGA